MTGKRPWRDLTPSEQTLRAVLGKAECDPVIVKAVQAIVAAEGRPGGGAGDAAFEDAAVLLVGAVIEASKGDGTKLRAIADVAERYYRATLGQPANVLRTYLIASRGKGRLETAADVQAKLRNAYGTAYDRKAILAAAGEVGTVLRRGKAGAPRGKTQARVVR